MHTTKSTTPCPDWATALLNGFSQVLLQRNPLCGLCCLLAILLTAPQLVGGALLGALAGLLTAQRRGYERADRQTGLYSYNGVLIGILISHALPWSALVPPLVIAAGGLSSILVHQWLKRGSTLLPAYTMPFVLIGWGVLSLPEAGLNSISALAHPAYGVAMGVGQIFLLDQPLAGVLILFGLFVANPKAAGWALAGSTMGGVVAYLLDEPGAGRLGLYGFNAALAAIAFSGRGLPLSGIALLIAIVVQAAMASIPMPTLTAPFVLACWCVRFAQAAPPMLRRILG